MADCTSSAFPFVTVRGFSPNTRVNWLPLGTVQAVQANGGATFTLAIQGAPNPLRLSFLSQTCVRVQFSPTPDADYNIERSIAVVNRAIGGGPLNVSETAVDVTFDTGAMRIRIEKSAFRLSVFRGQQLVHSDEAGFGLVYIPGESVTANFKITPAGAHYTGVAEKAGGRTLKDGFSLTNFNWDNFGYNNSPLPPGNQQGPLNPAAALYCSVPFLLETNPAPHGDFAGAPYACGLFFDNVGQSFFNIAADDYGTSMSGKYYFGALYGDLDYYFMLGDRPRDVLKQYTALTGRSPMPPKYVFGFHQGAYGYHNRTILETIANAYRSARFPIDCLHIDVDFQDNYRTFTHSELKFPQAAAMFASLRQKGFKCSTNITPLLTQNPLNERAQIDTYQQRAALLAAGGLIFDTRAGYGPNPALFEGTVSYGMNRKVNLNYAAYPGLQPNSEGNLPLTATGNYPDFGRADVRATWGQQYAHLINDLGIEMIWQDMTCPALAQTADTPCKTFPLNIMTNDTVDFVPHSLMHNAYAALLLRATWEGLRQLRPAQRNFIISRGGFAGMQRYAGLWTGDSGSTWDFLRVTLPEVLNIGISGIPIAGADVGGFANLEDIPNGTAQPASYRGGRVEGGKTNYELLTRWMQLGSFLPWFRNHYDGYNKEFQEPIKYGEPVPTNTRKYVELRYRMLQLYYDYMFEWTQTGMPIVRALFLNDPDDVEAYAHLDDEFFVGRDLLVAPILEQWESVGRPGPAIRDVYVPLGADWYAFKEDGTAIEPPVPGGTLITGWRAGLDLVPLYVRAGGIIPLRQLEQYVGELSQNPLTLTVYPGPDRDYLLYQDDGLTTQAERNGTFRTTRVSQTTDATGRAVRVRREHDQYDPPETFYRIALLGMPRPSCVRIDGTLVIDRGSAAALDSGATDGFFWDASAQTVYVKMMDSRGDTTVKVFF
ncbi:MAG TPA: TIM-barrel domain-containing protein [Bryobacteraceae bacterium]|nr:TIM-barrel domain-containing protein [Bryobacteraceae bacterium]